MEREKIIFLRDLFLRAFVVGVLFAFFYWIATLGLWRAYAPWIVERFKLGEKELGAYSEFFCERADSNCLFLPRSGAGPTLEREESLTLGIATIVKV
jgi:hypothetical protein